MSLYNHKVRALVFIAVFMILFFLFSVLYKQDSVRHIDVWVMKNIVSWHQESLNSIFITITNFASRPYQYAVYIFFTVIWIFAERKWREPFVLGVCIFGIRYSNHWLKNFYDRDRPAFHPVIEISGYSFPSGHAMISIAFFSMLAFLLVQNYAFIRHYKKIVYGLTGLFVFLVGFSRVYLGVHYPTDVLSGFFAGGIWLLVCILLYGMLQKISLKTGS
jgi:undecaprenyl-diphosphatase